MLALETYAQAMREQEMDLGFVSLGASDVRFDDAKRRCPAPSRDGETDAPDKSVIRLVELGGIEPPTLRLPVTVGTVRGGPPQSEPRDIPHFRVRVSPPQSGLLAVRWLYARPPSPPPKFARARYVPTALRKVSANTTFPLGGIYTRPCY